MPDLHSTKRTTNHITPVCEAKSSSCQLIYIREGQAPIFKCFTAIIPIFKLKGCRLILLGGCGSVGIYTSSLAELNSVHMVGELASN